jgi:hypothetical protein
MPFQKGNKPRNTKEITWVVNDRSCWICTSHYKDYDGYPRKWINGKKQKISRIFYEKYKGLIPQGMHVLHTCDTPACINPDHLWLGTHYENMQDMAKKGRTAHLIREQNGEKNHMAKLTESQVLEIRSMSGFQREIAQKYGISRQIVSDIKNYRKWKHLI